MSPRDGRSVGELLLQADTASRGLLFDVSGDDAPAMLRTWGEVVQNAAELWQALPVRPRGDTADGQLMAQLEAISQGMHRTRHRHGWPGDGDPDQRLLGIAEALGAARDLVAAHASCRAGVQSLEQARDVQAARTRIMHTLYVSAHSVSVAVREHIRDLQQMPRVEQQSTRATRGIPRGQDALDRLTAFEELAGSFLGGRLVRALEGEHREGYAGLARLGDAIARWDLQARRTLAAEATPANLSAIARTQATINRTALILVRAAAHTGVADPVIYEQEIAPTFEQAIRAQSHLAGQWASLTNPTTRRVDPNLGSVAEQLQAATRELIHDKTALAEPTLIAQRADLRDLPPVIKRAIVGGFILSRDIHELTAHGTSITAPAKAMLEVARNSRHAPGPGDDDSLGESLHPNDLQHNRVRPLIEPVRDILVRDINRASGRQAGASHSVLLMWSSRELLARAPAAGRARPKDPAPPVAVTAPRGLRI